MVEFTFIIEAAFSAEFSLYDLHTMFLVIHEALHCALLYQAVHEKLGR